MTDTSDLQATLQRATGLLGADADLAALLAAILAAGNDGSDQANLWAEVTGRGARDFAAAAMLGRNWQAQTLPGLADALGTDPKLAIEQAQAIAELAAAAAGVLPIDLNRVNAAAFIAAAQLRQVQKVTDSVPEAATDFGAAVVDQSTVAQLNQATSTDAQVQVESTGQPAVEDEQSLAELLAELDELTGLTIVKTEVRQQAELLRVAQLRDERGMKNPTISKHMIFTGNPGTGKTTVARLVAKIYRSLGLLEKGHLVEVDRSGLTSGYLGQTEEKTAAVIQKALGGVLFIDEAYALAGDQYGEVAINTLVKAIEDHRDNLVVIVAGYPVPMQIFIDSNPGLESRLRLTISFADYNDDELIEIFKDMAAGNDYEPSEECIAKLRELLSVTARDESFGNARFIRNVFEAAVVKTAWRLKDVAEPSDEELRQLIAADLALPALEPPMLSD